MLSNLNITTLLVFRSHQVSQW